MVASRSVDIGPRRFHHKKVAAQEAEKVANWLTGQVCDCK